MTCIAGIAHPKEKRVYIAADSAGSNAYQIAIRRDPKVFRCGAMVIGCMNSFRMTQLLHYALVLPAYTPHDDLERYMVVDFVNAVRACLQEGGFARKKDECEEGGTFLVGFQGRLFCINSDYQVGEAADGYSAIGSGDEVALGVLFATRGLALSPPQRLELALQAAAHHIEGVRAPFLIECAQAGTEREDAMNVETHAVAGM